MIEQLVDDLQYGQLWLTINRNFFILYSYEGERLFETTDFNELNAWLKSFIQPLKD
jgi:hypothetical protein